MTTFAPLLLAILISAAPAARTAPEAGVRQTVAALDAAWNAHDMRAFAAHFTPDGELVNPVGMCWEGRPTIEKALTALHRTMFKNASTSTGETRVRFVAPHVAVAVSRGHASAYTTPDGHAVPASDERATYVLVERDGRWLVTSGQITTIDPLAAQHDPAKA